MAPAPAQPTAPVAPAPTPPAPPAAQPSVPAPAVTPAGEGATPTPPPAATTPAAPAAPATTAATPPEPPRPAPPSPSASTAYVEARFAAEEGANERASRNFRQLLAGNPSSRIVASRALEHGLSAGDWPLAINAARRLDTLGALPQTRRLLLLAEAVKTRNWNQARQQVDRIEREQVLALMVPMLRAWVAQGSGQGDPSALLAPMDSGPTAAYAVEHRALLALMRGQGDLATFLALDADASLRVQRLRIAAASEFAARGRRAEALQLLTGDQPALIAARRLVEAGRPVPGRIETAADGIAEFLSRVTIDFSQQGVSNEAIMLARIAAYMSPSSAEPPLLGAELLAEADPAAGIRLLRAIPPTDPFARAARDLRMRLLIAANRTDEAIAEARATTDGGSTNPADWSQLGDLLISAARNQEAAVAYARAHELWRGGTYPEIPEWTLFLAQGSALERGGDWAGGLRALQEAYRLAPEEPLVLNYLGYAQLDRHENLEEAERLVRRASELAPNNPAITDSLGWALYRRGRVAEALPLLERAARGAPDDTEINEHLGDVYYAAGRRIEARHAWRAALVRAEGPAAERIRGKIDRGLPPTRTAER